MAKKPILNVTKFTMVHTPLRVACSIDVANNVPPVQDYNASTHAFTPDYTLTPLTLIPRVSAIDSDQALSNGAANDKLTNIIWYEIQADGTRKTINQGNSVAEGYGGLITTEGDPGAGTIQVKKNVTSNQSLQLLFTADLLDSRTGEVHKIKELFRVSCSVSTPAISCNLDVPENIIYNPLRDDDDITARLEVRVNGDVVTDPTLVKPVWEYMLTPSDPTVPGVWVECSEGLMEYAYNIAADKFSVTIHRHLMGEGLALRVRIAYDADGGAQGVTLASDDTSVPMAQVVHKRVTGRYEHAFTNTPDSVTSSTAEISPAVVLWDNQGVFDNPLKWFAIDWYACASSKSTGISETTDYVGSGVNCPISISCDMLVAYAVGERDPAYPVTDSSGNVLTIGGKVAVLSQ